MRSANRYDNVKRAIDVVAGSLLLVLSLPIQAVIALVIRIQLGSPILFRQDRPGRNGELFELIKFRSMRQPRPGEGIESDGARIVPLGKRLRSLSLDELPTLLNVVRGEMSLVGPRPLLVPYLDRYTLEQARRHEVRPGITGLAQVSGRNALSWEEKFRLDVEYVDSRSLKLDIQILLRTLAPVLGRHGINEDGSESMTEFKGADNGA